MLIERIDIQLAWRVAAGDGLLHLMNMTNCHCELQVTESMIYFVFSEIRENQILGDRTEELCGDLCMGPQAVP